MWVLITFGIYFVLITTNSKIISLDEDKGMELAMRNLVLSITNQSGERTIMLTHLEHWNDCGLKDFGIPMIVRNSKSFWYLKGSVNSNLLNLICAPQLDHMDSNYEMESLFLSLQHMRSSKMIFLIYRKEDHLNLQHIREFFEYCWKRKSLNVLVLFRDFHNTKRLYGYKPFPKVELQVRQLDFVDPIASHIFPPQLRNSEGHVLLTLPDQVEPRCVLSFGHNGKPVLSGYVGHFIQLFADYINASLHLPYSVQQGEILFYGDLEQMTWNNSIDLAGTLVPAINAEHIHLYSYPFEFARLCLMIPVAENKPIKELFFYLMNFHICIISLAYLYMFTSVLNLGKLFIYRRRGAEAKGLLHASDFILNDVALRGILGQPFVMMSQTLINVKVTYILLSLTGLYLSLIYQACLQTLLTQLLRSQQPTTFEDLREKPIYTLMSENEMLYFDEGQLTKENPLFSTVSYEVFRSLRNSFNTTYAYPATNMDWETFYRNQQNYFSTNLFIYSDDACFQGSHLLSFPLSENSIYQSPLNNLILLVRAHGFIDHWFRTNFIDMVAAGRASFRDLSKKSEYGGPITIEDMEWIITIYVIVMSTSIAIFLVELRLHRKI